MLLDYKGFFGRGGASLYFRITLSKIQSGNQDTTRIKSDVCQGNLRTATFLLIPFRIISAACSASMTQGMSKLLIDVMGVLINPGQMVETWIPLGLH
jgi:hypothetical protein